MQNQPFLESWRVTSTTRRSYILGVFITRCSYILENLRYSFIHSLTHSSVDTVVDGGRGDGGNDEAEVSRAVVSNFINITRHRQAILSLIFVLICAIYG